MNDIKKRKRQKPRLMTDIRRAYFRDLIKDGTEAIIRNETISRAKMVARVQYHVIDLRKF